MVYSSTGYKMLWPHVLSSLLSLYWNLLTFRWAPRADRERAQSGGLRRPGDTAPRFTLLRVQARKAEGSWGLRERKWYREATLHCIQGAQHLTLDSPGLCTWGDIYRIFSTPLHLTPSPGRNAGSSEMVETQIHLTERLGVVLRLVNFPKL